MKFLRSGTRRSHLEVNDQTRLAQLGLKTKGMKLFSNDEWALKIREKEFSDSFTDPETFKDLKSPPTGCRKPESTQLQFKRFQFSIMYPRFKY